MQPSTGWRHAAPRVGTIDSRTGDGPSFQYCITRQVITSADDIDDQEMLQLRTVVHYAPCAETEELGSGSRWCPRPRPSARSESARRRRRHRLRPRHPTSPIGSVFRADLSPSHPLRPALGRARPYVPLGRWSGDLDLFPGGGGGAGYGAEPDAGTGVDEYVAGFAGAGVGRRVPGSVGSGRVRPRTGRNGRWWTRRRRRCRWWWS